MEDAIVLLPSPGAGHMVSMVELGKLLLVHKPSLSIVILVFPTTSASDSATAYIHSVAATAPSIAFHHLPAMALPPNSSTQFIDLAFEIPKLHSPNIRNALISISQGSNLRAFVVDFFCSSAFDVSSNLGVPAYFFYTSGAAGVSVLLYLTTLDKTISGNIRDVNGYLHFPATPPLHSSDMPKTLWYKSSDSYNNLKTTSSRMANSSGILVNTFEALDPRAVKALSDGLCIPGGKTPPIFFVGPLVVSPRTTEHECLSWLDSQPRRSVVFLCFGSMGLFKAKQLKEMAVGLEKSGQRFLWVVRSPPSEDKTKRDSPPSGVDLDVLLPEGFLGRTKGRGLVVESWAPQVEVLSHHSVGGFVTHCGWNSILESVRGGVPMVAWPLYAEQKMNRVFAVEEMKVALRLKMSDNEGFVTADELEEGVRELMEGAGGKAVRNRVATMRSEAAAAIAEGGSSRVALSKLLEAFQTG